MKTGTLVEMYIQLRDRRAARKAAFDIDDSDDKAKQEKIEGLLMQRFKEDGVDSVKTPAGTAYTSMRTTASVADGEAFFSFCRETEQWDLIEKRASKTAVIAYRDEHNDLPPGINWSEQVVVNVRRS